MDFTPDEMSGFERAAIKPYLNLETFMKREDYSYSSRTELYVRTSESQDRSLAHGLICLHFRNGVTGFKAEIWECYDGEGLNGLNEGSTIGEAWFPHGTNEDTIADVFSYAVEAERLVGGHTSDPNSPDYFSVSYQNLQELFSRFILRRAEPFAEPKLEAAKSAVQAMIESASA